MVKLGFIVEGDTETIILERSGFFDHLRSLPVDFVAEVINAQGNGNLLPKNIVSHTETLKDKGATHIIILTDLDADKCITSTKDRINALPDHTVIVSVRQIEAWYLADTDAMRSFLKDPAFSYDNPEDVDNPYEKMRSLRMEKTGRGIQGKPVLANAMIGNHGFSITSAALHPNCNSAKYFLNKIKELAAL